MNGLQVIPRRAAILLSESGKSWRSLPSTSSLISLSQLLTIISIITNRFKDDNTLRSYQLEGLNWLMFCWHNKQSSILADEMVSRVFSPNNCLLHSLFRVLGKRSNLLPFYTNSTEHKTSRGLFLSLCLSLQWETGKEKWRTGQIWMWSCTTAIKPLEICWLKQSFTFATTR